MSTQVHTSLLLVGCPMYLMGFLHLVYTGNYIKLQTGHFPALPGCDNLSASQPLY